MSAYFVLLLNLTINEDRTQHAFFNCFMFSVFIKGKMETKCLTKYLIKFKHFTKLNFFSTVHLNSLL